MARGRIERTVIALFLVAGLGLAVFGGARVHAGFAAAACSGRSSADACLEPSLRADPAGMSSADIEQGERAIIAACALLLAGVGLILHAEARARRTAGRVRPATVASLSTHDTLASYASQSDPLHQLQVRYQLGEIAPAEYRAALKELEARSH